MKLRSPVSTVLNTFVLACLLPNILCVTSVFSASLRYTNPINGNRIDTENADFLTQDLLPELVRRIKPSAVAIETFDSHNEKLSRGSGFFIENDRIVTNRHVIEGAYRAEIHSSTGTVYPVRGVLAVDAEGDIAVLKIDSPTTYVRPLPL
ncbi:MAG TPA: S1C family serine protease, partial [Pyrinomonadaceae bacterium]